MGIREWTLAYTTRHKLKKFQPFIVQTERHLPAESLCEADK